MKPLDAEEMVLEGVMIPFAWEPSGEVKGVSLMTFDEDEYRIDSSADGDHGLRDYLRKRVRLSVVVRGDLVIRVKRVELLGSSDLVS